MTPAIQLEGLTKRFGQVTAVDGIDLTMRPGEVVALLGQNGAGKSTTIDLALGLAGPTAGTVELFGGDPRDAVVAGRVGAMLQGGALLPAMTVRRSVALIAAAHRHPLPVDEALARAKALDIADRRVSKLSGGETQRARFAVAVVSNPDLLVLDEPTAAMDVSARHLFWSSMHEFADQGRTVVFATHYLEEADAFAARIVIIDRGRVVADGTPAEIKAIATGRTLAFTLDAGAAALDRLPGVTAVSHRGDRIALVSDDSDSTLRALLAAHPEVRDIEIAPRSMDDAFLRLTAADPISTDPTSRESETVR